LSTYSGIEVQIREDYAVSSKKTGNVENSVTRFGINADNLHGAIGAELASIYVDTAQAGSSKGGSKVGSSSKSKKEQDSPHMLHPLEIINIREALDFAEKNVQKTVLVDIFARKDTGQINIEQNGSPEIHSIVLCRQQDPSGKDQVLVIDPSNSHFSRHIAANADLIFGYGATIAPAEIVVSSQMIKIYVPPQKVPTGPNPDQPRDCVDIAVKIAFGLNKHQVPIDIKDLVSISEMQEITNNTKLNPHLFFEPVEAIARVRQASNDKVRDVVQKILQSMKKQIDVSKKKFDGDVRFEQIKDANVQSFTKLKQPDEYRELVEDLLITSEASEGLFRQFVDGDVVALKGECAQLLADI
jgi:hypothetical protein